MSSKSSSASKLAELLYRRRRATLAIVFAVTVLALPQLLGLGTDNALEAWIDHDSEAWQQYQGFLDTFGSEEFILVVYPLPQEVGLAFLERLTDLRFELEEIAGVRRVDDLAGVYGRFFSVHGLEAFRRELASPFLKNVLVSADQRLAATWVHLETGGTHQRERIATAVEEAVERAPPGGEVHLAGSPILNAALDRASRRASRTLFPLVFVLSAVVLWVFFRRLGAIVVPFVSVGAGIVWTLALLKLLGGTLDMVTVALPPLVWVLGLSTSIHLLVAHEVQRKRGASAEEAVRRTLAELVRPCAMSAVTTAIGFASLVLSSMPPVRQLGAFAALGILLCLASNFLLFPSLVRGSRKEKSDKDQVEASHFSGALADWLVRRPRTALAVSALPLLILGIGIVRLRVESNPIEFFRHDAPIVHVYKDVLADFTGPYSLEVVLTPPSPVASAKVFIRLAGIVDAMEAEPGVARVVSAVDLVRRAHQENAGGGGEGYRVPTGEEAFADAWERLAAAEDELRPLVSDGEVRLSVVARPMGSQAHRRLVETVEAHLAEAVASWQPRLTGIVALLVDMQDQLVQSQIRSFGLAFLLIGAVMAALLRRGAYALAASGPNLLPIVFALGVLGLFDVPLNAATIMIAGIALGIGVNDTIHFLERYRRARRSGEVAEDAVTTTLAAVGRPMVVTSVVAALGFLMLLFSEFVPLFHFGLLTAVTVWAALLGDLVMLPALLLIFKRPTTTPG